MKVAVLCEYSRIVSQAFEARGHDVTSCDIIPSDVPGKHHIGDAIAFARSEKFDLIIAHPPCTFLCKAQFSRHAHDKTRFFKTLSAAQFVRQIMSLDCPMICVENPIGYLNNNFRKPDQIIYPWWFGDKHSKDIALWLKGLPPLMATCHSTQRVPVSNHVNGRMSQEQKSKIKSKFFPAIAEAMAKQWG
jgi:site-specific DNA-cytosine methylase